MEKSSSLASVAILGMLVASCGSSGTSSQQQTPQEAKTSKHQTSNNNQQENNVQPYTSKPPSLTENPKSNDTSKPSTIIEYKVIYQTNGWMITNQNNTKIIVNHMDEKGNILQSYSLPIRKSFEQYVTDRGVFASFPPNGSGWILLTSSPGAGLMDKTLYSTTDDGAKWNFVSDLSRIVGYPTGITFRNVMDGWLTATYHGGNPVPLYHTNDGGKAWSLQKIDIPTGYKYGNSFPPVFDPKDSSKGTMKIEFVNDNSRNVMTLATSDGGYTWTKYMSSAVDQESLKNNLGAIITKVYGNSDKYKNYRIIQIVPLKSSPLSGLAYQIGNPDLVEKSYYIQVSFPNITYSASLSQGVLFVAKVNSKWTAWYRYK